MGALRTRSTMRFIPAPLRLPTVFLLAVLFRIALASLVTEPTVMGDELSYKAMAEKFHRTGDFFAPGLTGVSQGFSNVLYQLLISSAFFFDDFFAAIKLINALLVSLTVFPIYALIRVFRDETASLTVAALSALMPFHTISIFVMAENLYIPLFWTALYFFYRGLADPSPVRAALGGVFLGLLFLTKPQAISLAMAFAVFATVAFIFARRFDNSPRSILLATAVAGLAAFLIQASGNYLLHADSAGGGVVGSHYTSAMERPAIGDYFTKSFLGMSGGHIAYLLILFALPVVQLAYQGMRAFQSRDRRRFLFVVAAVAAFGAAFAMALIFTQTISHIEHNLRLHARYYSFIFPLFLISVAALPEALPDFRGARIALVALLVLIAIAAIATYRNFPSNAFGVDYADWAWLNLRFVDKSRFYLYGVPVIALGAFVCLQAARSLRLHAKLFFVFYGAFCALAGYGQTWNTTTHIKYFHSGFAAEREFIRETVGDFSRKLLIVEHGFVRRCNYVFWLPYQYTNVIDTPPETIINQHQIAPGTEWVILIGEHEPAFEYREVHERPHVKIYRL